MKIIYCHYVNLSSRKIRSDKMLILSEVHLVKYLLYVFRASQVTYWPDSVMCVSETCSVTFQVLQPGREKGMQLNLEDDRTDSTTPGYKRSDECVFGVNLFCASSKTF